MLGAAFWTAFRVACGLRTAKPLYFLPVRGPPAGPFFGLYNRRIQVSRISGQQLRAFGQHEIVAVFQGLIGSIRHVGGISHDLAIDGRLSRSRHTRACRIQRAQPAGSNQYRSFT